MHIIWLIPNAMHLLEIYTLQKALTGEQSTINQALSYIIFYHILISVALVKNVINIKYNADEVYSGTTNNSAH